MEKISRKCCQIYLDLAMSRISFHGSLVKYKYNKILRKVQNNPACSAIPSSSLCFIQRTNEDISYFNHSNKLGNSAFYSTVLS